MSRVVSTGRGQRVNPSNTQILAVVLDAMGVVFEVGDDVADLLIPFIGERGGDVAAVADAYLTASLGRCDADAFWRAVGLDPAVEDDYLQRLRLMPGVEQFVAQLHDAGLPALCLSNDVARWAAKLRRRFGLDDVFELYLTSAELGVRKPDARAFDALIPRSGYAAHTLLFIDDRAANVRAACNAGLHGQLFEGAFPGQLR
jgi:putative hydrolase of the HAD superfamily